MKISGFTFIKNAILYDYPIVEAISSILPICDEVVVAVGKSEDATLSLIQSIDSIKVKIVETEWDDNLREGGRVLAVETDKAFAQISPDSDWAFYIQGDEVVHEKYLSAVYENMQRYQSNPQVDGLLFNYLHFYASYDYIGTSMQWYSHEIRVIKNNKNIYAYRDAQGFRKNNNEKLVVVPIDAYIYHYGWVKEPEAMQRKQENFCKLWYDDSWVEANLVKAEFFNYKNHIDALGLFTETHPKVMQARISRKNWKFDYDISYNHTRLKHRVKNVLKKYFRLDFSYKNFVLFNTKSSTKLLSQDKIE